VGPSWPARPPWGRPGPLARRGAVLARSPAVGPSWPARPPWGRPGPSRRMYTHCCALHRHSRVGPPTHPPAGRPGLSGPHCRLARSEPAARTDHRQAAPPRAAALRAVGCNAKVRSVHASVAPACALWRGTCVRAMAWHLRARYGVHASMHTHNHARPQTYTPRYVRTVPWLSPPTGGYSSASAAL
jgi:hypothetical protein